MHRRHLIWTVLSSVVAFSAPALAESGSLPPNTVLQVRITERLSSETARPGDAFHGTLAQPVVVDGKTVFDKGADVKGEVMLASKSGRLSSPGQLQLALTSISNGWFRSYPVSVQPLVINGASHTKSNIGKIGGSAAAGAIVGGVAAGGKGAAIGAGVGAATGTVIAAATGKHEAVVESEAVLAWTTIGDGPMPTNTNQVPESIHRDDRDDRYNQDSRYNKRHGRGRHDDGEDDEDDDQGGYGQFSAHDRIVLRGCLTSGEDYSNLPSGLAKRDRLPPGLEKQVQRNGTLPPGLQKRVQPLPHGCEVQLPRLPRDWERVILSGRVILLDPTQRIMDIFYLNDED